MSTAVSASDPKTVKISYPTATAFAQRGGIHGDEMAQILMFALVGDRDVGVVESVELQPVNSIRERP